VPHSCAYAHMHLQSVYACIHSPYTHVSTVLVRIHPQSVYACIPCPCSHASPVRVRMHPQSVYACIPSPCTHASPVCARMHPQSVHACIPSSCTHASTVRVCTSTSLESKDPCYFCRSEGAPHSCTHPCLCVLTSRRQAGQAWAVPPQPLQVGCPVFQMCGPEQRRHLYYQRGNCLAKLGCESPGGE